MHVQTSFTNAGVSHLFDIWTGLVYQFEAKSLCLTKISRFRRKNATKLANGKKKLCSRRSDSG